MKHLNLAGLALAFLTTTQLAGCSAGDPGGNPEPGSDVPATVDQPMILTLQASEDAVGRAGVFTWQLTSDQPGGTVIHALDANGATLSEWRISPHEGGAEITQVAPATGALIVAADGTVEQNTLEPAAAQLFAALSTDLQQYSETAVMPYFCWGAWLGTAITCGAAAVELGANPFANIGCGIAIAGSLACELDD